LKFETVRKFLEKVKREFGGGNKESKKVVGLKEFEQG